MYKLVKEEKTNEKTGISIVKVYVASRGNTKPIVSYTAKGNDLDKTRAKAIARCNEWIENKGVKANANSRNRI